MTSNGVHKGPITSLERLHFHLDHCFDGQVRSQPPLCFSHGRIFSPTFACLPPFHSPGLQCSKAQKSSSRSKRRSHARTWLFRLTLSRAVSNASSHCNRSCYRVAKRPTGWPMFVRPGDGSTFISLYPYNFPHCWCLGGRKMPQEAWGLVQDGVRVLLVEAESK